MIRSEEVFTNVTHFLIVQTKSFFFPKMTLDYSILLQKPVKFLDALQI